MPSRVQPWDAATDVELCPGFREGDVQHLLTPRNAIPEKLETQRRLAAAGIPFDQVDALGRKTAAEELVESRNASGNARIECGIHTGSVTIKSSCQSLKLGRLAVGDSGV